MEAMHRDGLSGRGRTGCQCLSGFPTYGFFVRDDDRVPEFPPTGFS